MFSLTMILLVTRKYTKDHNWIEYDDIDFV